MSRHRASHRWKLHSPRLNAVIGNGLADALAMLRSSARPPHHGTPASAVVSPVAKLGAEPGAGSNPDTINDVAAGAPWEELKRRNAELERANRALRCEVERRRTAEKALLAANDHLSAASAKELDRWNVAGFVGRSPAMQRVVQAIRTVMDRPRMPVLVSGEPGTGKELVARAIHFGGPLARRPLVTANCQGLAPDEIDRLLFGGSRRSDRCGRFEAAREGTLLIEAPEDLTLPLQTRLMDAVLDSPAGRGPARIIAISTADLAGLVNTGRFRSDLFYHLMSVHIRVPSLRERLEDVPALAAHFLKQTCAGLRRRPPELPGAAIERLVSHTYPGNIRELKNTIERAALAAGAVVLPEQIVFAQSPEPRGDVRDGEASAQRVRGHDVPLNLREAEKVLIRRALAVCGGNVSAAARLLGVNRARLYRRK